MGESVLKVSDQAEIYARAQEFIRGSTGPRELRIDPMTGPIDIHEDGDCNEPCSCYFEGIPDWETGIVECRRCDSTSISDELAFDRVTVSGGDEPLRPDWVRKVRDDCEAAGVEFVFESWGDWQLYDNRVHGLIADVEDMHLNGCELIAVPDGTTESHQLVPGGISHARTPVDYFIRVGREKSGRTLDGREWLAPEVAA